MLIKAKANDTLAICKWKTFAGGIFTHLSSYKLCQIQNKTNKKSFTFDKILLFPPDIVIFSKSHSYWVFGRLATTLSQQSIYISNEVINPMCDICYKMTWRLQIGLISLLYIDCQRFISDVRSFTNMFKCNIEFVVDDPFSGNLMWMWYDCRKFTRKKKEGKSSLRLYRTKEYTSMFIYEIKWGIRSWTKLVMTIFHHAPSGFLFIDLIMLIPTKKCVFLRKFAFSFIRYSRVGIDGDNYCQIKDTLNISTLEYKKEKKKIF